MLNTLKKIFRAPYQHRAALEKANLQSNPDMAARNLGYSGLDDLVLQAEKEEHDHLLKQAKEAEVKLAEAARLMAESESAAAKARELESMRRDLYINRNRIEVRLKELEAFDYVTEEGVILSELTAIASKTYGDLGYDPRDNFDRSVLVERLSVLRTNRDVFPAAIARLKERFKACVEAIERIEAA